MVLVCMFIVCLVIFSEQTLAHPQRRIKSQAMDYFQQGCSGSATWHLVPALPVVGLLELASIRFNLPHVNFT